MRQRRFIADDIGIRRAISAVGSGYRLAQLVGVTPNAVYNWIRVPTHQLAEVARITGLTRKKLRPDLYRNYCSCRRGRDHKRRRARPVMRARR